VPFQEAISLTINLNDAERLYIGLLRTTRKPVQNDPQLGCFYPNHFQKRRMGVVQGFTITDQPASGRNPYQLKLVN